MTKLLPGDIVLTRGEGWLSKRIRDFTRSVGEDPTLANHVGVVVEGGSVAEAIIVEALRTVNRHSLMRAYGSQKSKLAVFRPLNLKPEELAAIVFHAESYVGRRYGYAKILLQALDFQTAQVFQRGDVYFFRRLALIDRFPICSYLVAEAYWRGAHKTFGVEPRAATPDDIWDFCENNSDKYAMVRELAFL